eukprot:TRINITY_DN6177_c0_g1_i1.p1 TRINITY_DN6177_c0_g1~~TRINITY_DN6177_c0_g1_i1.p1  ORF type:complete len:169 (+),score=29.16 TRINITY_DN6177_c0_g1_i1:228-734(+)
MAGNLRRRIIHFANLPLKLVMPSSTENIKELAFKTIPSASKIEIKRILESLYGFDVKRVNTVNIAGKKKKRGGFVFYKPDYKKAYVILRRPLSLPKSIFPINAFEEIKKEQQKEMEKEGQEGETVAQLEEKPKHWLEDEESRRLRMEKMNKKQSNRRRAPWHSKFAWR